MVKPVSSAAALALLVVAVPIALITVGGMPFAHVGVAQISGSLTSNHVGDPRLVTEWIAGGALVLAWLAWAWMTVCVVVELRSWVTGRIPVKLPASRTAQSVAAFLVGTALALSAMGRAVPSRSPRQGTSTGTTAMPLRPTGLTDRSTGTGDDVVPIARLLAAAEPPPNGSRNGFQHGRSAVPRVPMPSPVAVLAPEEDDEGDESADEGPPRAPTPSARPSRWGDIGRRPTSGVSPAHAGSPDPLAVPRTHLVRSRETLWSIAEDELGTALRWHELAEYNYGITQADGRSLDEDHWVVPGWRLLLPPAVAPANGGRTADAVVGVGVPATPAREPVRPEVPGPLLPPEPPVPASTGPRWADHTELVDLTELVDHTELVGHTELVDHTELETRPVVPPTPVTPTVPTVPVVPLGGGVVGAGVVRLLDRLRRVQQRHRPEGGYIRLPDGDRSRFERRLRAGDGWAITQEVDVAIRRIVASSPLATPQAAPASVPPGSIPQVLGVRIHPEVIELVLAGESRRVAVVERSDLLVDGDGHPTTNRRAVAPLLATVGQGTFGPVMVNLESLGSLVVSGNPDEADAVVRALALELATSYWAGQFSVAVVGFGSELDRFEGVTSHAEVADLIGALYRRRIEGAELLRSRGYTSFAHARHVEPGERWAPLVVICGPAVGEADVVELLDIASDPVFGMAAVAVGERVEAQYSVRLTGGTWADSLESLGAVAFPQRIERHEWDQVAALLDTAATRESVLSSEEPYVNLPIRLPARRDEAVVLTEPVVVGIPARPAAPADPGVPVGSAPPVAPDSAAEIATTTDPATDTATDAATSTVTDPATDPAADTDIVVAVLGPVQIRGAARPFTRAWAEELVVYLAMHPSGASNEAWATALWPDRLMAPSSLHSTASVARRSLGQAADGTDHLPRSHGRLALARTVGTDWDRFVALAGSDRTDRWRQALTLVRGRPFEGLRSSDWPILEGIAPAIESAVVDLSGRLAGACLRQGNAQGAEWAARRGLVVSPYDERLYRMLMRAADAGGNPAGVDAVMAELLRLVADDIEPLDAVHPSTMDLYRQLSRRRRLPTPRS